MNIPIKSKAKFSKTKSKFSFSLASLSKTNSWFISKESMETYFTTKR